MITKFKAWKKTNDPEMFEDIRAIDFEKNIIRIGYKLSEYTTRIDEESLDNVELLQSTGLFDKNGTEIYESEIVDVSTVGGRFYLRGIVKKVKGGFYIEELTRSNVIPLTDFYFKGYTNTLEIKIIGSIYQDEHLLEEE